jgi:hypothetical protein
MMHAEKCSGMLESYEIAAHTPSMRIQSVLKKTCQSAHREISIEVPTAKP